MTMLYPKLERSFNAEELHQMLSLTLSDPIGKNEESRGFRRIERPPMPRGSSVFEQAKGELEIERQTEKNGTCTLPSPSQSRTDRTPSGRTRLTVPLSSPVPPSSRGGHLSRHNSGRRSPSPFSLAPNIQNQNQKTQNQKNQSQSGRLSPFLQVPSASRPTSARSNHSGNGSRSGSPR